MLLTSQTLLRVLKHRVREKCFYDIVCERMSLKLRDITNRLPERWECRFLRPPSHLSANDGCYTYGGILFRRQRHIRRHLSMEMCSNTRAVTVPLLQMQWPCGPKERNSGYCRRDARLLLNFSCHVPKSRSGDMLSRLWWSCPRIRADSWHRTTSIRMWRQAERIGWNHPLSAANEDVIAIHHEFPYSEISPSRFPARWIRHL